MYTQIIYFVIALSLFGLQHPGDQPVFSLSATIVGGASLLVLFRFVCRLLYERLNRFVQIEGLGASAISRHNRLQSVLSLAALVILAFNVYILNIKYYFIKVPFVGESLTVVSLVPLLIYMLHLMVMWSQSYKVHASIHNSTLTRQAYIKAQWAFNFGILAPWLFISLAIDFTIALGMGEWLNSAWGQAGLLGFLMLFFMLFGPWFVVKLWGCKPIEDPVVSKAMQDFCRDHGFSVGDLCQWPIMGGESLTAGIIGIFPKLRYILVTKGLLSILSMEELRGVMAHEMGHVRHLHIPFFLFLFITYFIFANAVNDVFMMWLLQNSTAFAWATATDSFGRTLFSIAYGLPFLAMLVVYFRFIFGFFLRNSERQADLYAMKLQGHPYALISSLQKIAIIGGQADDAPNWHHYSIRERMEFLSKAFRDKTLIKAHHIKLYSMACMFFLLALSSTLMLHHFQQTPYFDAWQKRYHTHLLEKVLNFDVPDAELYGAYGGLLLQQDRYGEAREMLLMALEIDSRHAVNLNNLAWLYATAPEPFFNPEQALDLAHKAARLEVRPYILDTLAEAYFVNEQYEKALEVIQKAVELKPDNLQYYLDQKKKFRKALGESSNIPAGDG